MSKIVDDMIEKIVLEEMKACAKRILESGKLSKEDIADIGFLFADV